MIRHGARSVLEWKVQIESVDASYLLPIFIDGVREKLNPYRFVASEGTFQLIHFGNLDQVKSCVDATVPPLKAALETHDPETIGLVLRVLQALSTKDPAIGEGLVPHYRQLLPTLNIFINRKRNLGDKMDYAQRNHDSRSLGESIEEALTVLEQSGGRAAFSCIKYIIPTYESCQSLSPRVHAAPAKQVIPLAETMTEDDAICQAVHGHHSHRHPADYHSVHSISPGSATRPHTAYTSF